MISPEQNQEQSKIGRPKRQSCAIDGLLDSGVPFAVIVALQKPKNRNIEQTYYDYFYAASIRDTHRLNKIGFTRSAVNKDDSRVWTRTMQDHEIREFKERIDQFHMVLSSNLGRVFEPRERTSLSEYIKAIQE